MADAFYVNWTTQLRKGLLELAILNALRGAPLYGYEIVRRLSSLDHISIAEGTIYPILSRLLGEGYVESFLQESNEGPARKYYRLTQAGRDDLRRMNKHWQGLKDAVDNLREE